MLFEKKDDAGWYLKAELTVSELRVDGKYYSYMIVIRTYVYCRARSIDS